MAEGLGELCLCNPALNGFFDGFVAERSLRSSAAASVKLQLWGRACSQTAFASRLAPTGDAQSSYRICVVAAI